MKRKLCLVLAALLLLTMSAACGGAAPASTSAPTTAPDTNAPAPSNDEEDTASETPESYDPLGKYDPPLEITAVNGMIATDVMFEAGEDAGNNVWIRAYEEYLGIKADVWWGSDDENKMALMMASGDMPDVFAAIPIQFYPQAEAGRLADLTEAYEKYASPLTRQLLESDGGAALASATVNGKLYGIPMYNDPAGDLQFLFVREDWRTKMNLPEPKTMDDVLTIARAFTFDDPDGNGKDDTIGIHLNSIQTQKFYYTQQGIYAAFQAYPQIWVEDGQGGLMNGRMQGDQIKAALQWMQDAYKEGLISREWPLKKSDQFEEDTANERYGLIYGRYWYPEWPLQIMRSVNPEAEWKAYPYPSATGEPAMACNAGLLVKRYFVCNSEFANPEALIKMINLSAEKFLGETADPDTYYIDPVSVSNIWKMTLGFAYLPNKDYDVYVHLSKAVTEKNPDGLTAEERTKYDQIMKFYDGDQENWWVDAIYGPGGSEWVTQYYMENNLINLSKYTGLVTENMSDYDGNLYTLFDEVTTKIILNEAPVSDYDNYMSMYMSQGGQEITADVNEWYQQHK